MHDTYIVASPGRTGSHIILEMLTGSMRKSIGLANACAIWLPYDQDIAQHYIDNYNTVIQLHDLDLIGDLDPSKITAIVSLRRDRFAQIMSLVVAQVVNEWNGKEYSDKTVEPVVFDTEEFVQMLHRDIKWHMKWDFSVYKKVVTIYYEDLIAQGAEFLARELGLEYNESKVGRVHQKSPYSYKDIILNWEELYQEYLKIMPR